MLKRIIKIALVTVACLLVLISFTPMLLSLTHVNQFVLSFINKRIAGKLHAQEIRVGWTDGISVKGLTVHDPQGRQVALFKKISCDVALLSLIHAPAIEGKIEVDSPKIQLIDDQNSGHFSLEDVLTEQKPVNRTNSPANELTLSDLHLAIDIQPQGQAKVKLVCQIENKDQDKVETGSINLAATCQNFADLEKAYKQALGEASQSRAASVVALDCYIDHFPVKAALPFVKMADPRLAELLLPALGSNLNAKISHTLRGDELGISLFVKSPELHAKLKSQIKGNNVTISEEGSLHWKIRPKLFRAIQEAIPGIIPEGFILRKPSHLIATLQPDSGQLGPDGKMPLDISWKLDSPLSVKNEESGELLAVNMVGSMSALSLQESIEMLTDITVTQNKDVKSLHAACTIDNALTNPQMRGKASLSGPMDATIAFNMGEKTDAEFHIDSFQNLKDTTVRIVKNSPEEFSLTATGSADIKNSPIAFSAQSPIVLKDDTVSIQLTGNMEMKESKVQFQLPCTINTKTKFASGTLAIQGDGLDTQFQFQAKDELTATAKGQWNISPERFRTLQNMLGLAQSEKQQEMKLQDPLELAFNLKNIKVGLKGSNSVELLDSSLMHATLSLSSITLSQKEKKSLVIPPVEIIAELVGKERLITFSCESKKGSDKTAAEIAIKGTASDLWTEEGLALDNARILVDTKIKNLPLDIFYSLTAKPETADKVVALFGQHLDINIKADLKDMHEGAFRGKLESPRLNSEVACLLKEGTLTLEKPITAEYTLTPEAGVVLLKDINPLLVTAARSETPIKLHIDSKDFSIPVKPFSLETMKIRHIKLEPGILTCKNGGMLSLLTGIFKLSPATSEEVTLWFTPIYVEVKDGIVNCKRSDALLADAFPIATWGTINLIENRIDMILGLSGTAIARGFAIPKLDPQYMVQIPIHGTTQSPKIDSGLATTKIAALKLQQHRSNTTSLIGGLLEVATTMVEKDAPVPAPTTHPFPWNDKV